MLKLFDIPGAYNNSPDIEVISISISDHGNNEAYNIYNKLTNEPIYDIHIQGTIAMECIDSFKNITTFDSLTIRANRCLMRVSGFDNLKYITYGISIDNNPKLITMSIPGNLVRSVDYSEYGIIYDDLQFNSPPEFINSPVIINDMVSKFNPVYHNTQVINQIIENVEEWGTEETKDKVMSYLISKGVKPLIPQEYLNRFDSDTIKSNNDIIKTALQSF